MTKRQKKTSGTTKVGTQTKPVSAKAKAFDLKDAPFKEPVPKGYDFAEHSPLKRASFDTDATFFKHRRAYYLHRADVMDAKAAEAEKFGDRKQRAQAKKIKKLKERMTELRSQLEAQGVDVDAILASAAATE